MANAFGNYRQVLQDVTLNPAMGYYLNTRGNQKEKRGHRPPARRELRARYCSS